MMGWILFGFLTALGIESFIRVAHSYERTEPRRQPQHRVQVSFPWYLTAGGAYYANKATKKRSRS